MRSRIASLALALVLAGTVSAAPVGPGLDEVGAGEMLRPVDGGYERLPLLAMDVDLQVTGTLVHGRVTQRFSNPTDGTIDALYVFPLPENAAVDGMEMRIGDRRIVAVVKEREEAKATYEAARLEGKKASLVEQDRPNLFKTSVANVNPGEEILVQLSYLEEVSWRDGEMGLVFPLTYTPRYVPSRSTSGGSLPVLAQATRAGGVPRASIRAHVAGEALLEVRSSSHTIDVTSDATGTMVATRGGPVAADRDFLLAWTFRRSSGPAASAFVEDRDDARYALVMVVPPAPDAKADLGWPTDTIFVVDISGSMAGESMEAAKAAVSLSLDRLRPGDSFDVLAFDDGLHPFQDELRPVAPASLLEAHRFVDALDARGGTEIVPALARALDRLRTARGTRAQRVILLTDGAVGNEEEAFREVAARRGDARVHVIGIGAAPNRYLMRKLAEVGRGSAEFVDARSNLEPSLDAFFRRIDRPILTDVTVDVESAGSVEIYPARLPDLYAGDPLFLSLRLASKDAARIRLGGRMVEGTFRMDVPLSAGEAPGSGVAARFGRKRIAGLLDSLREGADEAAVRAEVIEIATEFRLVSRYTSLVAVEEIPTAAGPSTQARVPNGVPAGTLPQTGTNGPLVLLAGALLGILGGALFWASRA